ncbi:MAG TPA: ABC transporter permease [Terracidiphilus sp.]|jgi:predicted permease|nr:ABC transporter permease [Terracidiphilus sp.]
MDWIRILLTRISSLLHRRQLDADLDDELRAHIDLAIAENLNRGMPPEDARIAALRAFGGITQTREAYRNQRGFPIFSQGIGDLRFALRQLRKSPGFSLTAILTLALGIGAVTSVFTVVNGVLLKPFAFRDPGQLVVVREVEDEIRSHAASIPDNYRHYLRLKQTSRTLEDAAIFQEHGVGISPDGNRPNLVGALDASSNFFRILGVQPILGRDFAETDSVKGAPPVVLLSYSGWQTFLQGNPKVIGQTMTIGGFPATVIGVLPPGFRFPHLSLAPWIASGPSREIEIFEPLTLNDFTLKQDAGAFNFNVIARLKTGVSLSQAQTELDTLQKAYTLSAHLPIHLGIALTPFTQDVASGISGALWVLLAAVGAVLLIACVNLANLQLARAVSSEREIAVRAALGASKFRLVWARLTESILLACMGGAAGIALAFSGVRLLVTLVPSDVPRLHEVQVNSPVLLFAVAVSIAAALLFGILPALRSLRVHPQAALQANSSRTVNTQEGRQTRSVLIGAQVACTIVLLIVTALALRSFSRLLHQDRGFDSSHVTLAQVDLFAPQYDDKLPNVKAVKLAFADRALAALARLPGVQSVALTSAAPLTGETWVDDLTRPDHPVADGKRPMINVRWIDPEYLSTMQTPLVAGRNISAGDRANPYVALISETTARQGFPGENPIGRKLSDIVPDDSHFVTVIGVVADTHINGLRDSSPMVYLPYWAYTPWTLSFLVRSSQSSTALIPEIRRTLWGLDPQVTIPTLLSMDQQVSDSVATDRFQAVVLASFGAAGLFLALLGVYGVLAYSVSLRQQEFGIRIALGSGKAALMRLVLLQAAYPVFAGAGIGLALALLTVRWIRSLLYQTPVLDPLAIGCSILLLFATAAVAALVPARHAASIDPMRALRTD